MRVIWSPDALEDIERIFDYVSLFNPPAARHLAERLFTAAAELEHFPYRGRRAEPPGCRELTVIRPYVLVYEIRRDEVQVLRLWHGAQHRPRPQPSPKPGRAPE